MTRLAIYAGSFDPPTNGHADILTRALELFDQVVVAVAFNPDKAESALLSPDERVDLLRRIFVGFGSRVEVDAFPGLLVDYARARGAHVIVRGLRAVSDYEYELQMALMNRALDGRIETVFLMASQGNSFISSRLVKEIAALGGDVRGMLHPLALKAVYEKLGRPAPAP